MKKKYPLAKPHITPGDIRAVTDVLKSGNLSLGPKYTEFEQAFGRHVGRKYAVSVSSGTAGLHLALIAAGIGPGDEVITSPFSFVASANSILYVGARPVFVDIDPVTYNIDPAKIAAAITPKTKAIMPVHIFGQAADMDPIMRLAKKHRLKIIEDACESVDATYKGKKVGTFGESAVFAFYPNKQMTTGEGGMIVTNDRGVYEHCASLRNQGRGLSMEFLQHEIMGYNYRLDEMSAALGLSQLKRLNWLIKEKDRVAGWYSQALAPYRELVVAPFIAVGNQCTWFVYVARLLSRQPIRDRVMKQLAKRGIPSRPYLPSIHLYQFYRDQFGFKSGDYPICEAVSSATLALPFYIGLTRRDISYIVDQLIEVISQETHG